MTEKKKARYIAFLRDKLRLIEAIHGAPYITGEMVVAHLASTPSEELRFSEVKCVDGEMDLCWREGIGETAMSQIAAVLKEKHGFARIAADPERVLAKITKRGKIETYDELRVVLDHLAFVGNPSGEEER